MSEEHDHDLPADVPTEKITQLDELAPQDAVEAIASVTSGDPKRELLPLLGGGVLLLSALKSLRQGKFRGVLKAGAAAGLLSYGLRQRRSSEAQTFEPDLEGIEGGSDEKEVSDHAYAAAEREDTGKESQTDASGDVAESAQLGEEGNTGSRVEFTEEADGSETRTKPDHVGDEEDPRRDTADGDETVEIDVSDTAMAEETAEATGPDPEQAQPAQTDSIEPEESPEEDASDMKVEPDEDSESASEDSDDAQAEADDSEDDEDDER